MVLYGGEEKIHSDWSDLYLQTIFCCNNYFNHLVDCQNKPNYQYQLNLVFVHRVAKVHFILKMSFATRHEQTHVHASRSR